MKVLFNWIDSEGKCTLSSNGRHRGDWKYPFDRSCMKGRCHLWQSKILIPFVHYITLLFISGYILGCFGIILTDITFW